MLPANQYFQRCQCDHILAGLKLLDAVGACLIIAFRVVFKAILIAGMEPVKPLCVALIVLLAARICQCQVLSLNPSSEIFVPPQIVGNNVRFLTCPALRLSHS